MRQGRPADTESLFAAAAGQPWTKSDLANWRNRRWKPALPAAGLAYAVPYAPLHVFASLLLAEGRTIHCVSGRLGLGAEQTCAPTGSSSPSTPTA